MQVEHSAHKGAPVCRRLWWELRPSTGFFSPTEADGHVLDLAACFAGSRVLRFIFLVWSVQVFMLDVYHYPPHNLYIYMGYLTHWGHVLSIFYLATSFLCSVKIVVPPTVSPDRVCSSSLHPPCKQQPTRLIKVTWFLYSLSAPLELAICLMFWSAVAAGPSAFSYVSVMEHGGIAILVWIDGNCMRECAVPVRAKHVIFLMMICCAYLFWTGVDAVLGIGNGEWGPAYTDDALYPVLNWNSDRQLAATVSAVAVCVVAPACFAVCWMTSLWSPAASGGKDQECDQDDEENAGVQDRKSLRCCCFCLSGSFDGSQRPVLDPDQCTKETHITAGASDYIVMEDRPVV